MNKVELLSPAGSLEKIEWAIRYGADAVYIGGEMFSLRANAINFNLTEIKQAVTLCHQHGIKLYVALNIVFHDSDLLALDDYLLALAELKIDALIISDLYAIKRARMIIPEIDLHVSTQASILNIEAARYYQSLGVTRVVLARETPYATIKDIINHTNLEVEVFIHGAMCSSFSGRCTLSNNMTNRDANHGGCSQVCRFDFDLLQNQQLVTADFPFSLAAKDLMMAEYIQDLINLGVHSLKIEGRMRSIYYIAMVVGTYRRIIDQHLSSDDLVRLRRCANREAVPQFLKNKPDHHAAYYNGRTEVSNQDFLGIVLDYNPSTKLMKIEERNAFSIGTKATVFGPHLEPFNFIISTILDEYLNPLERANHPHQIVYINTPHPVQKHDIVHIQIT